MTDPLTFLLAALALLATPGPTNTLLATAGISRGFSKAIHLVGAEITGYAISVTTLSLVIGPIANQSPLAALCLKVACGLYLAYAAWGLFEFKPSTLEERRQIRFRDVLIVTIFNPKGIIFAFVIVPHLSEGQVRAAAPYMAALALLIVLAGSSWCFIGSIVRTGGAGKINGTWVNRTGAVVLSAFSLMLLVSALEPYLPSVP